MKILWEEEKSPYYGGKINQLIDLINLGMRVPNGLILSANEVMDWLKSGQDVTKLMSMRQADLVEILEQRPLPDAWLHAIKDFCQENRSYIVRSSALMEDHELMSFAGQYDSIADCRDLFAIERGIRTCILSLFKPEAQAYWQRHNISWQDWGLAILIQEELKPQFSGVCFSLDLTTNQDKQLLIEYVEGGAEALVSGRVQPEQLRLPWYQVNWELFQDLTLPLQVIEALHKELLTIVAFFGYPVDVEWCYLAGQLYLLQVRPITSVPMVVEFGRWTTANFRDGGVAAQPCPNLMWSLYQYAWQNALSSFLLEVGLAPKGALPPLSHLHYARPYWNLGLVKKAMEQIPGYIERDFDDELGVYKDYQGTGYQTRLTPFLLGRFLRTAIKTQRLTQRFLRDAPSRLQTLQQRFDDLQARILLLSDDSLLKEIEDLWQEILYQAYIESENTYFWQAYINTIQLSMKKTRLLNWLTMEEFLNLIANLEQVSHTKPLQAMLDLAQLIREDDELKRDWKHFSVQSLVEIVQMKKERADSQAIYDFQKRFGYHSKRELDLRVPSYGEEIEQVIETVQRLVREEAAYQAAYSSCSIENSTLPLPPLSKRRLKKVKQISEELRHLLWWREEFKDMSTRYYHLIRQISLQLGRAYQQKSWLKEVDDIFYLQREQTQRFIESGHQDLAAIRVALADNRHYCQAYQNFEPIGDLTDREFQQAMTKDSSTNELILTGMVASSGQVTGRVRVLLDIADIQAIQAGEILVTRFTDTGWSYVFSVLGGLVTEYGGILCHASIVARECGVPTLVCVKNATKILKTGMLITLDGKKGEIQIHEEK